MEKIIINGGKPLFGEVEISGAKNAALAIIPAAILSQDVCTIENLPLSISDVCIMMKILNQLGAKVRVVNKHTIEIDSRSVNSYVISNDMTKHLRASYYFIGALLGRYGRAKVALPGGCYLGPRPIDQHIKGFEALGATVSIEENAIVNATSEHLTGSPVYLDMVSVGATVNVLLAAVKATGLTVIENAAKSLISLTLQTSSTPWVPTSEAQARTLSRSEVLKDSTAAHIQSFPTRLKQAHIWLPPLQQTATCLSKRYPQAS